MKGLVALVRRVVFSSVIALFAVGCAAAASIAEPPEIRFGADVCDECGMIINQPRFSAAYVTIDRDAKRFDDIGDMLRHGAQRGDDIAAYWVHDYDTEEWIRAEHAWFVQSSSVLTPMGHGIAATGSQSRAEELASSLMGTAMTFEQIRDRYRNSG